MYNVIYRLEDGQKDNTKHPFEFPLKQNTNLTSFIEIKRTSKTRADSSSR